MKLIWILIICIHLPISSADYCSLTYDEVMTPDWKDLESSPQYEKDCALLNAINMPNIYSQKRRYIAAAIYAGASVPIAQLRTSSDAPFKLLPNAVIMDDLPLVALLLEHGADIDERGYFNFPALYFATNPKIAKTLIAQGAMDLLTEQEKAELAFKIMRPQFDPALVTLYQPYFTDLINYDQSYNTPLMHLAVHSDQDMVAKAQKLFEKLSPKLVCTYITNHNHYQKNVFDMITNALARTANAEQKEHLVALQTFLINKLHEDTCAICFDPLDTRTCLHANGHLLHATCLAWTQQNINNKHAK